MFRPNHQWRGIFALVYVSLLVAACGTTGVGNAAADTGTNANWSARLSVTGGFAGVHQHIEIDHNGRLSVDDDKRKKHVDGQLTAPELKKLDTLVQAALATPPAGKSGRSKCFDCFNYTLTLKTDGRTIERRYDTMSVVGSSDYPLVHMLSSTMARQLSPDKKKPSC